MGHAILAPSAAHRWLNCTPSARLALTFPDVTSAYAEEGSTAHKVCELYGKSYFTPMPKRTFNAALKKLKADPLFAPEMEQTAQGYLDRLKERAAAFESAPFVAFETRVDASAYAPECVGTCDCLMIGEEKLIITDYKHGKGVAVFPENNPQLMLYALGALAVFRPIFGDAIRSVMLCVDQPRVGYYGGWEVSTTELRAWGEGIKPKAQAAFDGVGDFAPGEHCKFCPAKGTCRARAETYSAYADFINLAAPKTINPLLSNAEIGGFLKSVDLIKDWCDALKTCAREKALAGENIPGWKLVEGRKGNRAFDDVDAVFDLLKTMGFPEASLYNRTPKSLTEISALMEKKAFDETLAAHVTRAPGAPTLAPESDARAPWNSVLNDFQNLEKEGAVQHV